LFGSFIANVHDAMQTGALSLTDMNLSEVHPVL
jgi:hypothetical protein